jgi:RNA ligase (TIGR02306 family)
MEVSNFKVPYTTIQRIEPHTNAHSLELAFCYGFQLVVQKGRYVVGSKVVFSPIDSLIPQDVEVLVFGKDAKVKLEKGRVRQIKLRGCVSQGLIIDPETLKGLVNFEYLKEEQDLASILNITKYEPEEKPQPGMPRQKNNRKSLAHELLHSYNGLTNIKWCEYMFNDEEVVIQCKLHGTNARAAVLPYRANTIIKKIKKFLGLSPKFENLYGSNRVDITNSSSYSGYYGVDIYGEAFQRCKVFEKLKPNEIVYGEIIGPDIQKNYTYGLKERRFILFDVKVFENNVARWLSPEEVEAYAVERGFEMVPVLYKGIYNKALSYELSKGPSVYAPCQPVREGIVIKSRHKYSGEDGNKRALKFINEDYLADKSNSDEH